MFKKLFNKKGVDTTKVDTRTEYEIYMDNFISVHVQTLNKLVEQMKDVEPDTVEHYDLMMKVHYIEDVIKDAVEKQDERKERDAKFANQPSGKKSKISVDWTQIVVALTGVAGTLFATSMVINNERDGNMMPQWSRSLVDRSLRK